MKKNYLLLFLLFYCFCGNVFAQKEENTWVSGVFAGINFDSNIAVPFKQPYYNDIWRTNASICDSTGNLLFYSNGFRVFNRNYKIMRNGDSLNIGDYLSWGYNELPIPDGAVIIPDPNDKKRYYLIHTDLKYINIPGYGNLLESSNLFYDIIDMTLDNGLGGVVKNGKDILFFSNTLTNSGIQAVKTGNGADWWIFCHEYGSSNYYRFLIDRNGIHGPYQQSIGSIYTTINAYGVFCTAKINRAGSQMIKNNHDSTFFELYDLDRCTGILNNRKQIPVSDTLYGMTGLSFSPNGRFAYISANNWQYLLQFDLQSENIAESKILIAKYDGSLNPFPTDFSDHAIGPDGKIYICNYDDDSSLHVINNPDSLGIKCDFVQNQLQLDSGTYWGAGFPNLPNYNLGLLVGSGCDTVITTTLPANQNVFTHIIYPNQSNGKFELSITGITSKVPVAIYNTMGELVFQTTLQPENGFIHGFFNLQNEPAGVYLLKAQTSRGEVTEKIVKE